MNKELAIRSILALALFALTAKAADAVKYLDWDPAQTEMVEKTCTDYTVVTAAWADGMLTISGKGTIDDFASAVDVPWQGLSVTNMTIASGVKPGRNLFAGFGDTTTVNGVVPVSLIRQAAGDFLVGGLTPAEATVLEIDGGQVRLTVDLAAPAKGEKG